MSERKVLNKYYPPDFDPAKIPRGPKGRNSTFIIRLMAPCNMRCTTCGEYIYKGRKFNARKEDVDDMNHLGLRIYRFYIKCTACLGEISFRTDPANTDYVLEAGATRNFEALAKAEKQAELEAKAYQEELESNPMKMLEERTEQSRNEMERLEAIEELQELNKREARINYDGMLVKYDEIRDKEKEQKRVDEEAEDEKFIKDWKEGKKIKRLVDADSSSSDEDEKPKKVAKVSSGMFSKKPASGGASSHSVTDVLTSAPSSSSGGMFKKPGASAPTTSAPPSAPSQPEKKPPAWAKSVGGFGVKKSSSLGIVKKNSLGVIVKKKS